MQENLKQVALVTGASSGIGRAIAIRLSQDGYFILAHFHKNEKGVCETLDQIFSQNGQGEKIQFSLKTQISTEIEKTLSSWFERNPEKPLSTLVNNAGVHLDSLTGILSDEGFDEVIKTNTYGPFFLMRFAVRKMIRNRHGSIVNIASLAGQLGNVGQINYAASKAALIAMTKTLAMEVGARGIRVNTVSPGLIDTEMIQNIPSLSSLKERIPLQRFGKVEEVANAVSFLISNQASYITGHTLNVNGGLFPY